MPPVTLVFTHRTDGAIVPLARMLKTRRLDVPMASPHPDRFQTPVRLVRSRAHMWREPLDQREELRHLEVDCRHVGPVAGDAFERFGSIRPINGGEATRSGEPLDDVENHPIVVDDEQGWRVSRVSGHGQEIGTVSITGNLSYRPSNHRRDPVDFAHLGKRRRDTARPSGRPQASRPAFRSA
jgi:hypothetical protein